MDQSLNNGIRGLLSRTLRLNALWHLTTNLPCLVPVHEHSSDFGDELMDSWQRSMFREQARSAIEERIYSTYFLDLASYTCGHPSEDWEHTLFHVVASRKDRASWSPIFFDLGTVFSMPGFREALPVFSNIVSYDNNGPFFKLMCTWDQKASRAVFDKPGGIVQSGISLSGTPRLNGEELNRFLWTLYSYDRFSSDDGKPNSDCQRLIEPLQHLHDDIVNMAEKQRVPFTGDMTAFSSSVFDFIEPLLPQSIGFYPRLPDHGDESLKASIRYAQLYVDEYYIKTNSDAVEYNCLLNFEPTESAPCQYALNLGRQGLLSLTDSRFPMEDAILGRMSSFWKGASADSLFGNRDANRLVLDSMEYVIWMSHRVRTMDELAAHVAFIEEAETLCARLYQYFAGISRLFAADLLSASI